ncbi:MAG: hypothetical protein ACYTG5_10540 [Planctomycetota bacterium]|jgi:hypothetical protein
MKIARFAGNSLACVAILVFLSACNSTGANRDHLRECECGTVTADTMGCRAECALSGGEACENPECTCEHEGAYKQEEAGEHKDEGKGELGGQGR